MSLLEMQRVFSRLLTDRDFQQAFARGTDGVADGYRLSERELSSLRGLRWDRLTQHAHGLVHARLEKAMRPLPLTAQVLESRLHAQLGRFCRQYPPVPEPSAVVIVEAERMCDFLTELVAEEVLGPPWVAAVIAYERIRMRLNFGLECAASAIRIAELNAELVEITELNARLDRPAPDVWELVPVGGAHLHVAAFDHPVDELVARLEQGEVPGETGPEPGTVAARRPPPPGTPVGRENQPVRLLFHKVPRLPQVRNFKINLATAELLAACDGTRTVAEVADLLVAGLPAYPGDDLRHRVPIVIEQLREAGILGLRRRR